MVAFNKEFHSCIRGKKISFVATTIRAFVATNQSLLPPFYETHNHPLEQSP
jgi:hypothetical protein